MPRADTLGNLHSWGCCISTGKPIRRKSFAAAGERANGDLLPRSILAVARFASTRTKTYLANCFKAFLASMSAPRKVRTPHAHMSGTSFCLEAAGCKAAKILAVTAVDFSHGLSPRG